MEVRLINHVPLSIAVAAGRTCWMSFHKGGCYSETTDDVSKEDKDFLDRTINKYKHGSIAEHLTYNFEIAGISRACLQELARHRVASLSVKSTRYTLKELKNEPYIFNTSPAGVDPHWDLVEKYCVLTGNKDVDLAIAEALNRLKYIIDDGISNDIAKYSLPEAYKTSLTWTINARSLQNFLSLRSDKSALWEIQALAKEVFKVLPESHKYLFESYVK